jgi:hypothetical protein
MFVMDGLRNTFLTTGTIVSSLIQYEKRKITFRKSRVNNKLDLLTPKNVVFCDVF